MRRRAASLTILALIGSSVPVQAHASFPGRPGRIAYWNYVRVSDTEVRRGIFSVEPDGSDLQRLTPVEQDALQPSWSADGTRLVLLRDDLGSRDVFTMNADGSGGLRLTDSAMFELSPTWSPSGNLVMFTASPDCNVGGAQSEGYDLFEVPSGGGATINITSTPGVSETEPKWSPDGTRIAYTRVEGNPCLQVNWYEDASIYVANADGTGAYKVADGATPDWSPDGTQLVFDSLTGNQVVNADGSDLHAVGPCGGSPVWSPDGGQITCHSGEADSSTGIDIHVMDADGTNRMQVTTQTGDELDPSWQPLLGPQERSHPRTVSLALQRHLIAKGVVTTEDYPGCSDGVKVKIQRLRAGVWDTIASRLTDPDGSFRMRIRDNAGTYRAKAVETRLESEGFVDVCEAAKSGPRRHQH